MAEESTEIEQQKKSGEKATIGDTIQINKGELKGCKGKVLSLRDNSVIVEIGINPKTDEPLKTVVNHKNYKKVK